VIEGKSKEIEQTNDSRGQADPTVGPRNANRALKAASDRGRSWIRIVDK
jgi:hypothetical protein